jgi:hypothetical protein
VTARCIEEEGRLAEMVAENTGKAAPSVYNLSADGLDAWGMRALVEQLHLSSDPVFVLGINAGVLSSEIHVTSIIWSEILDSEARSVGLKVPYRTGIFLIDNWKGFLPRLLFIIRNLFITGPQLFGDPLDAPWLQAMNRPEIWQVEIDNLPQLMREYESNKPLNLAIFARIIAKLKARANVSFILLEAPINPRWYDEPVGKKFFESLHNDLRQFAAQHGMSYLSATKEAALLSNDFVNYKGHIGSRGGRERCTRVIASQVANLMSKKSGH